MDILLSVNTARQEGWIDIKIDGEMRRVGRWSFQERREARRMSEISIGISIWPRQKGTSEQLLIFLQKFGKTFRFKHFSAHLVRMLDQEAECSFLVRTTRARNVYEQFLDKLHADNFIAIAQNALPQKST